MKVYSHTDLKAKSILQKIENEVNVDQLGPSYLVFAQNSVPIGILGCAEEPGPLLASPGTPYAYVMWLDTSQPDETIESFIVQALSVGNRKNIEYATASFPFNEEETITQFKNAGFRELADSCTMIKQLDESLRLPEILQFEQIKRAEMAQFVKSVRKFFQDSPDTYLAEALEHILELPAEFLNKVYDREKYYFAVRDGQKVGVLNFSTTSGRVSNMGVNPSERGKGYGRAILLFILEQLRSSGCKQANLRVHAKNKPAIHLYKSLGFEQKERHVTLIWRK
jgi:ribosomal protein S18 acetylase RimI-like enzyme